MRESKPIIGFRLEVIVKPDDIGFHAYCPALKGLHTSGDTEEEALQNAKYAAIAYLSSLIKHGDSIPVGIIVQEENAEEIKPFDTQATRHTEELRVACTI